MELYQKIYLYENLQIIIKMEIVSLATPILLRSTGSAVKFTAGMLWNWNTTEDTLLVTKDRLRESDLKSNIRVVKKLVKHIKTKHTLQTTEISVDDTSAEDMEFIDIISPKDQIIIDLCTRIEMMYNKMNEDIKMLETQMYIDEARWFRSFRANTDVDKKLTEIEEEWDRIERKISLLNLALQI